MHKATARKLILGILLALLAGAMPLLAAPGSAADTHDAPLDPAKFELLEKFHGHVCAGSIFGARLGQAAKDALRAAGGEGKLKAKYYNLSCPVDGIQVFAGTTYGNGALTVEDRDEHRLVLSATGNKRSVEARLTKKAEDMGLRYRELRKKAKDLAEGSPERARLERETQELLDWLRTAPTKEVVVIGK